MKKEILVRRDVLFALCCAYLTIPVIIFMVVYLKLWVGIRAALIMTGSAIWSCRFVF